MAQLRIDFQGRGKVETFSRARVQAMREGIQLTLGIARQVRTIGQVLAQQRGHMPEFLGEAFAGTPRIRSGHSGQDDQAGRPLHQGPNSRPIAGSFDEVAFPVAGYHAGGHFGGTFGNRRHVGDLAASVCSSRPRPAGLARLTQRGQQLAPQRTTGQHIQRDIDRLGRELFPHVVRIRASETSGNLLGRAALGQLRPHVLPQLGIQEFAGSPWLTGSGSGLGLRRTGAIEVASRAVASRLAAHGAGGASQHPRHRPERVALSQAEAQGLTIGVTQVRVTLLCHGNTVAYQGR